MVDLPLFSIQCLRCTYYFIFKSQKLEENEANEKVNESMLYGYGYDTEDVNSETTVIHGLVQCLI